MLIFDQLKKDDPQLRFLAVAVAAGMALLLVGLWWVQVVSSHYYQEKLEIQSVRTVRIPAVRGEILDRDGRVLAENRPCYNIDLYLEDLSRNFKDAYSLVLTNAARNTAARVAAEERSLGQKLNVKELRKRYAIPLDVLRSWQEQTRFWVISNAVADLSSRLQAPVSVDPKVFEKTYDTARAIPLPILANLDQTQVARFEEQSIHEPGMELEVQSERYFPNGTLAAHVLGYVSHDDRSSNGEDPFYNYRMDDFMGRTGIEGVYDDELRGMGGGMAVVVNNLGYRTAESVVSPAEPGENVVLTIDLDIQKAAESALQNAKSQQPIVHGAVVVMDAQNGDVLAMASAPTYDPGFFLQRHHTAEEWAELNDTNYLRQINRAMYAAYQPGSVFKIIVSMAGIENGTLDPHEVFQSPGYYQLGRLKIGDTAGPGEFDFDRAMAKSSNPYFITQGLKPGVLPRMIEIAEKLHLGERTGLITNQEQRGFLPTMKEIRSPAWITADSAFLCIGQDQIAVTPLQIAVMISAVANGGTVYWPRLVSRIEPYGGGEPSEVFSAGRVRDHLDVSARTLNIVHGGMRADVESPEGSGHAVAIPGLRIAGKTGTAEVEHGGHTVKSAKETWFVSYAPAGPDEKPRYVVVVMVEGGYFGGTSCVPVAHTVYQAIIDREKDRSHHAQTKLGTLAQMQ
jgi:penicillin-binding protein 2